MAAASFTTFTRSNPAARLLLISDDDFSVNFGESVCTKHVHLDSVHSAAPCAACSHHDDKNARVFYLFCRCSIIQVPKGPKWGNLEWKWRPSAMVACVCLWLEKMGNGAVECWEGCSSMNRHMA